MSTSKIKGQLATLLIGFVIASCGSGTSEASESTNLSPTEFQQKLAASPNAMLIDVRTMEEVQVERIKGQVNFDYNAPEFTILIKGLDKSKSYYIYCASGNRSAGAAEKMKDEGYLHVFTLDGGLRAWKKAGLPVQN